MISRATSSSSAAVKFSTPVTVNAGEAPCTVRSAIVVSPSSAKASLRIASIRPAMFSSLATVKSQAR